MNRAAPQRATSGKSSVKGQPDSHETYQCDEYAEEEKQVMGGFFRQRVRKRDAVLVERGSQRAILVAEKVCQRDVEQHYGQSNQDASKFYEHCH
jgi:hypothetical protein